MIPLGPTNFWRTSTAGFYFPTKNTSDNESPDFQPSKTSGRRKSERLPKNGWQQCNLLEWKLVCQWQIFICWTRRCTRGAIKAPVHRCEITRCAIVRVELLDALFCIDGTDYRVSIVLLCNVRASKNDDYDYAWRVKNGREAGRSSRALMQMTQFVLEREKWDAVRWEMWVFAYPSGAPLSSPLSAGRFECPLSVQGLGRYVGLCPLVLCLAPSRRVGRAERRATGEVSAQLPHGTSRASERTNERASDSTRLTPVQSLAFTCRRRTLAERSCVAASFVRDASRKHVNNRSTGYHLGFRPTIHVTLSLCHRASRLRSQRRNRQGGDTAPDTARTRPIAAQRDMFPYTTFPSVG